MATGAGVNSNWYENTASVTWGGYPVAQQGVPPGTAFNERLKISYGSAEEPKRKEPNMRELYEIYIVDPKTENIIGPIMVIAKDEAEAMLKADIPANVRAKADAYDFCVNVKGSVRAKKEVQKVKMVDKDDE